MTPNQMNQSAQERLSAVETVVERMDHELFGNGRDGVLEIMAQRISQIERWIANTEATQKAVEGSEKKTRDNALYYLKLFGGIMLAINIFQLVRSLIIK
jgi:hypothetical protein